MSILLLTPYTPEQRAKVAKSRLGNKNHLGKHHTEETRKKMSVTKKGRKGKSHSAETRAKISVAHTGKQYAETTLLKISETKRQNTPYKKICYWKFRLKKFLGFQ